MNPNSVFLATLETKHFSFCAVDFSRGEAESELIRGLQKHAENYKISPDWYESYRENIEIVERVIGEAYRDGGQL